MKHISVNLIITNIKKHQTDFSDLFDDMREATYEENESINNYIGEKDDTSWKYSKTF